MNNSPDYWFKVISSELAGSLYSTYKALEDQNSARIELQRENENLYDNILSDLTESSEIQKAIQVLKTPVTYNVCQSLVETLVSKLGGNKPGVRLLSTDADWSLRHNVKKLNNFLLADWERMKLHKIVRQIVKDSLIYNTGILKFYDQDNRVHCERVNPTEVFIDEQDGLHGEPRQFIQCKKIPKQTLIDLFPNKKSKIESANTVTHIYEDEGIVTELVEVIEGWYLPTAKGKKDGRHSIIIENEVLLDDKLYDNHRGPFVIYRWIPRQRGFWGMSVVEQVKGIQFEINKIALHIQRAIHLASKPYMLIPVNSKITPEVIDNDRNRLSLIYYTGGTPPKLETPSTINPELIKYLDYLYEKAYYVCGVSELHATGKKPAGVNSGVALRNYADIQTERFLAAESDLHDFFVECAHQTIYLASKIAENEDYDVSMVDGDVYSSINWNDITLAEEQYIIRPVPVSNLPKTWAGRAETLQELMKAQLIDPTLAQELLELPDTEKHQNLENSGRDLIRKIIEDIIDGQEYVSPNEYMPLEFAINYASQQFNLLQVKTEVVPSEILESLANWISEAQSILSERQMKQMQMQMQMQAIQQQQEQK